MLDRIVVAAGLIFKHRPSSQPICYCTKELDIPTKFILKKKCPGRLRLINNTKVDSSLLVCTVVVVVGI